jgi:hypothetical protein
VTSKTVPRGLISPPSVLPPEVVVPYSLPLVACTSPDTGSAPSAQLVNEQKL